MGVFSGDVSVAQFPANIRFAVYLEFSGVPEGKCNFGGEVRHADQQLLKIEAELDVGKDGKGILILPSVVLPFSTEGQFEILVQDENGRFAPVLSKRIGAGEVQSLS